MFWLIIIVSFLVSCIVLYYIIKWAVKSAILETQNISSLQATFQKFPDRSDDNKLSAAQKELKARYERSEITLEEYRKEWNKL